MPMNHATRLAISLSGLVLISSAGAQSVLQAATAKSMTACPAMVAKLADGPAMAAATKSRPISAQAVCSCAENRITSDAKLQQYLSAEASVLRQRMQREATRSYFTLRTMESVVSCLAPEFEATLGAIDLAQ